MLDNAPGKDFILFTGNPDHDLATRPPAKAPNPPPAWHAQFAARLGHSPVVSKQRLLRSRRSAAGQVRDAPPGSRGSAIHQRSCARFRIFSPLLLPGASGISRGQCVRPAPSQTRPAGRAQADQRSNGFCAPAAIRGSCAYSRTTGPSHSEAVSSSGASAQHSTPAAGGKKRR